MPEIELRPYQREALGASKDNWLANVRRQVVVLPTGTGKGLLIASLQRHHGISKKALVLVHRDELAQQALRNAKRCTPDLRVGLEMGDSCSGSNDHIVVAGVQSLGRNGSKRIEQFDPDEFGLVVIDEVHLAVSPTYERVIKHFGFADEKQNHNRLLFGCTATPNRTDGQGLVKFFDKVVYQMDIKEAIEKGWLSDLKGVKINTHIDLSAIKTRLGDFEQEELAKAVNTPKRNDLLVRSWMERAADRRTLVFTVDIQHAKDVAEAFQHYGVAAQAIWGADPDRKAKLDAHKSGGLQVLANAQLLSVGYDDPNIQCIVMARPTKSPLFYQQAIGRGTRLQEGISNLKEAQEKGYALTKTDCIVLDMADTAGRHSLVSLPSLFGVGERVDLKGKSVVGVVKEIEKARAAHPNIDFAKLEDATKIESFATEVDLFQVTFAPEVVSNSKMQWIKLGDSSYIIYPTKAERVTVKQDAVGKWAVEGSVLNNKFSEDGILTLGEAFSFAESMLNLYGRELITLLRRQAKWHADPATPAQIGLLRKFRIPIHDRLTKGEAAKLITRGLHIRRKVA